MEDTYVLGVSEGKIGGKNGSSFGILCFSVSERQKRGREPRNSRKHRRTGTFAGTHTFSGAGAGPGWVPRRSGGEPPDFHVESFYSPVPPDTAHRVTECDTSYP